MTAPAWGYASQQYTVDFNGMVRIALIDNGCFASNTTNTTLPCPFLNPDRTCRDFTHILRIPNFYLNLLLSYYSPLIYCLFF